MSGSRICSVANPAVRCYELFVVDFNMSISVLSSVLSRSKQITTIDHERWVVEEALTDEERIILQICIAVSI